MKNLVNARRIEVVVGVVSYGRVAEKDFGKYGYRKVNIPYYSGVCGISFDYKLLKANHILQQNEVVVYIVDPNLDTF